MNNSNQANSRGAASGQPEASCSWWTPTPPVAGVSPSPMFMQQQQPVMQQQQPMMQQQQLMMPQMFFGQQLQPSPSSGHLPWIPQSEDGLLTSCKKGTRKVSKKAKNDDADYKPSSSAKKRIRCSAYLERCTRTEPYVPRHDDQLCAKCLVFAGCFAIIPCGHLAFCYPCLEEEKYLALWENRDEVCPACGIGCEEYRRCYRANLIHSNLF